MTTEPLRNESGFGEWREIAEWDWVLVGEGGVLHSVAKLINADTADEEWYGEGFTACGRGGRLYIPGLFTRMGAKRCDRCCDRTGFPRGFQSPKNVDELRPLVEQRITRLRIEALNA